MLTVQTADCTDSMIKPGEKDQEGGPEPRLGVVNRNFTRHINYQSGRKNSD